MTSSGGYWHTCLIKTNEKVECYGNNDNYKQVSDTPTSDTYNFISSGSSHNCAMSATTSKMTCWGRGDNNQVSSPNDANVSLLSPSCSSNFFTYFTSVEGD